MDLELESRLKHALEDGPLPVSVAIAFHTETLILADKFWRKYAPENSERTREDLTETTVEFLKSFQELLAIYIKVNK